MKPMLTVKEVAAELCVSSCLVISLIDAGKLQAIDVSSGRRRSFRIAQNWLDAFVESSRVNIEHDFDKPATRELKKSKWTKELKLT